MAPTFRQSMSWLHTWAGVVLGSLLFVIFWMGTLSVFDHEIDRWMMPGTRLPVSQDISLDRAVPTLQALAPDARRWQLMLPSERSPVLRFKYDENGGSVIRDINPVTGELIPDQGTLGGTGFIFPFHFKLHLEWLDLGYWLVGLAGMSMLVMLVSGVIIHRKLFEEFFTFRPNKRLQRSSLDLHTLTGVLALPFHFVITLSGLIIFMDIYFPLAHVGAYSGEQRAKSVYEREAGGDFRREKANAPGTLTSLDAILARSEQEWSGRAPFLVRIWNPGDANSYIGIRRSPDDEVTLNIDQLYFDAGTGELLYRFEAAPVKGIQRFIAGMHFIRFEHWPLRWIYFLAGLSGCVMIATGFLYWLETRRKRHTKDGLPGVRIVGALTVGTVTGIVIATLAFFVGNRLLPLNVGVAGVERAALEVWIFYLVWLAGFLHAFFRPRNAWREQCWAIAVLAVVAVVLNAIGTGDHLLHTMMTGMWSVAGVDLVLLAGAMTAILAARGLKRRRRADAGVHVGGMEMENVRNPRKSYD